MLVEFSYIRSVEAN